MYKAKDDDINAKKDTDSLHQQESGVLVDNVKPVLIVRSSEFESESNNDEKASKYKRLVIRKKNRKTPTSPNSLSSYERKETPVANRPTSSTGIKFIQIKRYIKPKRKVFTNPNLQIYAIDHADTIMSSSNA